MLCVRHLQTVYHSVSVLILSVQKVNLRLTNLKAANAVYRGHVIDLCECIHTAFSVRMNMTKISSCKQEEGESIHYYLTP